MARTRIEVSTSGSAGGTEAGNRELRVLEVVGNVSLAGGAQRQVLEVVRRLQPGRFVVHLVHLQRDGGLAARFRDAGVIVHDCAPRLWDPIGAVRTAALLRRVPFDLVHAHLSRGEIVALAALWLARRRVPLVVHKHNEDAWWRRPVLFRLHRGITGRAVALVAPSRRVADFYRDPALGVVAPERFRVIPFGRVTPEPPPREQARAAVRRSLGLAANARVVLAAGRLVRQKRHDLLLESFAPVARRLPDVHLAIAGAGELEPDLQGRVSRQGLVERVSFLGLVEDLPTWLAGCDVFVNSSDHEGLPLVVLDAMGAGAPIVATAVSGVPDCVVDGVTGRLVPAGSPGPLTDALIEALEQTGQARRWGEAARRLVAERFSIDRAAAQWSALYHEVARPERGPTSPAG